MTPTDERQFVALSIAIKERITYRATFCTPNKLFQHFRGKHYLEIRLTEDVKLRFSH
jgi:hypothetical protein